MQVKSVFSEDFRRYGKVIDGFDTSALIAKLVAVSPKPETGTVYEPSCQALEALEIAKDIESNCYGGMPIEVGYCNGTNTLLNCLEYHQGSEVDIPADNIIMLVAPRQEIRDGKIDTSLVEAFAVPAGTMVQVYETTLHYAPCDDVTSQTKGFRVAVVLPAGTNTQAPAITPKNGDDKTLWAKNKWLIAHPDAPEAKAGARIGITGPNIDLAKCL